MPLRATFSMSALLTVPLPRPDTCVRRSLIVISRFAGSVHCGGAVLAAPLSPGEDGGHLHS